MAKFSVSGCSPWRLSRPSPCTGRRRNATACSSASSFARTPGPASSAPMCRTSSRPRSDSGTRWRAPPRGVPRSSPPPADLLGFPAGVLLDREGRAVALAPRAPRDGGHPARERPLSPPDGRSGRPVARSPTSCPRPWRARPSWRSPSRYLPGATACCRWGSTWRMVHCRRSSSANRSPALVATSSTRRGRRSSLQAAARRVPQGEKVPVVKSALERPTVVDGRLLAATRIPRHPLDLHAGRARGRSLLAPMTADDGSQWGLLGALALLSLCGLLITRRAMASRGEARAEKARLDHRLRLTVQHAPHRHGHVGPGPQVRRAERPPVQHARLLRRRAGSDVPGGGQRAWRARRSGPGVPGRS